MVAALAGRPDTIVIATSRRPAPDAFAPLPVHEHSRLVPVLLNDDDDGVSMATLPARLRDEHAIERVDVVVANAGGSSGFKGVLATDPDADMMYDFAVNAVAPARLFRAMWPLLSGTAASSSSSEKKFVLITSSVGSIGVLGQESMPSTAYGMSKAAANWFARKVSVEFRDKGLLVGIVHPG